MGVVMICGGWREEGERERGGSEGECEGGGGGGEEERRRGRGRKEEEGVRGERGGWWRGGGRGRREERERRPGKNGGERRRDKVIEAWGRGEREGGRWNDCSMSIMCGNRRPSIKCIVTNAKYLWQ